MAKSEECSTSELDLFCLPPTQVAIEDSKWIQVNPREVNDNYSIKFEYTAGDGLYIDLAKSIISFLVKIDGAGADPNDKAGPVNNTAHSLFKQIDLEINGQIVTSSNAFYPFESMLIQLLNYGKEAARTQSELLGYSKDTAGQMDVLALDGANKGLKARAEGFNEGEWRDYIMRPNLAMFQQERLLPPSTRISLNLVPSDPKFWLMADGVNPPYKTKLKELKLHMRVVKVNPTLAMEQAQKRQEGMKLYYPIRRLKTKPITIARGLQSHTEIVSTGQKPKRTYVAMGAESAILGNFKKNPFNFKNYDVNEIYLSSGITHYPSTPFTPDYTNGLYRESYMSLFSSSGKLFDDTGLDISLADFKDGYAIYCFDLTPDNNDGDHLELVKRGDVQLHVKFGTALTETVTILVISEYENTLQIDRFNTVIKDYMN